MIKRPLVSFAITTHNEGEYLRTLLNQLVPYCTESGDEIVIVDDNSDDELTVEILRSIAPKRDNGHRLWGAHNPPFGLIIMREFKGDFAEHKNFLNGKCSGEYIFQIDADETLHPSLLENLHEIINANEVDMYAVPRINIVNGLTDEDIKRWNWRVNEKGWVMFPDYQTRLYKNESHIRWVGKVHEQIVGFKSFSPLPDEEEYCIIHVKDIDRQRKQNALYQTIER